MSRERKAIAGHAGQRAKGGEGGARTLEHVVADVVVGADVAGRAEEGVGEAGAGALCGDAAEAGEEGVEVGEAGAVREEQLWGGGVSARRER